MCTSNVPVSRDQGLFAIALMIERQHGTDGPRVIAERIGAFVLAGETGAVELWRAVAARYEGLIDREKGRQWRGALIRYGRRAYAGY